MSLIEVDEVDYGDPIQEEYHRPSNSHACPFIDKPIERDG
jgi:hypothetical protein